MPADLGRVPPGNYVAWGLDQSFGVEKIAEGGWIWSGRLNPLLSVWLVLSSVWKKRPVPQGMGVKWHSLH